MRETTAFKLVHHRVNIRQSIFNHLIVFLSYKLFSVNTVLLFFIDRLSVLWLDFDDRQTMS